MKELKERITLTADDKSSLNELIDEKIKGGYLIVDQIYLCEQNVLTQEMCLPKNIDAEVNLSAIIQLAFLVLFMGGISYLIM